MTRDEYFALKQRWIKKWNDKDFKINPDSKEWQEFVQFSDAMGSMPPITDLFGGDAIEPKRRMFYNISAIKPYDRSKIVSIKTGLNGLDGRIHGLNKGELSIVSGTNGSGKSTWLSQLTLEAATQNFKSVIFSGELTPQRVKDWLTLQAAGMDNLIKDNWYYHVESGASKKIDEWMNEYIYVYDNEYGSSATDILKALDAFTLLGQVDLIVLDNLMSMDLRKLDGDKYEQQADLVKRLSAFAKKRNVHIVLVCHPRKSLGFLRKTDISGTADITNAADNVLIVHRVNNDFKRLTKDFFKWDDNAAIYTCSNVIEVCKNRDLGVEDVFSESYFDTATKRFLNRPDEYRRYGWEPEKEEYTGQTPFDERKAR